MSLTLTRAHIADELYRTIGLSHNESAELVEMFFEEILLCFEKGEEVKLKSFGTFKIRNKKERIGRNPKTGIEAKISYTKKLSAYEVTFVFSSLLSKIDASRTQ